MNELDILRCEECINELRNDFGILEDTITLAEQEDEMRAQSNNQGGLMI